MIPLVIDWLGRMIGRMMDLSGRFRKFGLKAYPQISSLIFVSNV
jgi:hypothetical protein